MAEERATIHLVPQFQYAPLGREDQRTNTRRASDLVLRYLEACQEDSSYHLLLSDVDCLHPFLAAHGHHREFVRKLVGDGRIDTGGAYNQPNEMCLQGEAIVRNMLYGRLYHEEVLGGKPSVYLPLSVFGHCVQLPQIAAKAGFAGIVWSRDIAGAPPLCHALAPDGTALLQKREPCDYQPQDYGELLNTAAHGLENQAQLGLRHDLRLLGGEMAPPAVWLTGRSPELGARDPMMLISTPGQYLSRVKREAQLRGAVIPVVGRDFGWYHMGSLVTRAELKTANRLAENRLLEAEKWATLAALAGAEYPDGALDRAWRQVLFGQHYGAISGTCADVPFLDLLAGYREALELACEVAERSREHLASGVDTQGKRGARQDGEALIVFNSLSWERSDVCLARVALNGSLAGGFRLTDEHGSPVPCQVVSRGEDGGTPWAEVAFIAEVPSLGYRTYYLQPAQGLPPEAEPEKPEEPAIENEHLCVRADGSRGGGLTSIYDKRVRKELLNPECGLGNELVALAERPDREMAAWELWTTGEMVRSGDETATVSVLRGPVFSRLRVKSALRDRCDVVQEVTLYRGLPRIDLCTRLERYRGEHELLALSFPLALGGNVLTFEDRFASVVRKASAGRLAFRTLREQNLSRCGLGAAQNWVDAGPVASLAIVSGRHRVGAVPLGPCAIVSARDLKHRAVVRVLEKALLSRGITCTHLLETDRVEADTGACAFRISLGRDNAYSREVLAGEQDASAKLEDALKHGAWGGVLVRRSDPEGQGPEVPVLVADTSDERGIPYLVQALAEEIAVDGLQVPEGCDFSGLRQPAEDHGVALINQGSPAASLEGDGTLVGLLSHTAPWGERPWGEGLLDRFLVPEHKSHVFRHALLPHRGDWRSGGVVRAGYEANSPLVARQTAIGPGALPVRFSLVSSEAENVVITAVKPVGNPLAEHLVGRRSDPAAGILMRAYEWEGRPAKAALRFGAEPQEAWVADLMERKKKDLVIERPRWRRPTKVELEVSACGIETMAVRLAPLAEGGQGGRQGAGAKDLMPAAEPAGPSYCRYWDHNVGAAPIWNGPVTLWMEGPLPLGQNTRFTLGISNDNRGEGISGTVEVSAPAEWTMIPRQVPFRIPAGSQAVYEVMVIVPPEAQPCFVRAEIREGERVVQDVLPVGEILPLEAALVREGEGFRVKLRNPNPDYVEGQVALVTPLESWGRSAGAHALGSVAPRLHGFRLEAGGESSFAFTARGEMSGMWAVAKLMWYGRVQYVQESESD